LGAVSPRESTASRYLPGTPDRIPKSCVVLAAKPTLAGHDGLAGAPGSGTLQTQVEHWRVQDNWDKILPMSSQEGQTRGKIVGEVVERPTGGPAQPGAAEKEKETKKNKKKETKKDPNFRTAWLAQIIGLSVVTLVPIVAIVSYAAALRPVGSRTRRAGRRTRRATRAVRPTRRRPAARGRRPGRIIVRTINGTG
jgi:hypothetical protein